MRRLVLSLLLVIAAAGCGGGGGSNNSLRCVPGDSKACAGPGQCAGYQVCRADGSYDPCNCGGGTGGTGGMSGSGGMAGTGGAGGRGGGGGPASCSSSGGAAGTGGAGGSAIAVDAGRDHYVSDGPSSNPVFQTFCAAVRASMISRLQRCWGVTPEQAQVLVNIDACDAWGTALDAGRMTFDGTNATSCATALEALSCAIAVPPPACDGVLTGAVPNLPGGPTATWCSLGRQLTLTGDIYPGSASLFTECVPGSFCVDRGAVAVGGRSTCVARPRAGEACATPSTNPCLASICDHTGQCAAARSSGESCTNTSDCASGLYCASTSTCAPRHATGSCSSSGECLPPATCNGGSCSVRARGGCCTGDGTCAGGEFCSALGTCYLAPVLGQACEFGKEVCWVGFCDATNICQSFASTSSCIGNPSCGPNALCLLPNLGLTGGGTPTCGPAF